MIKSSALQLPLMFISPPMLLVKLHLSKLMIVKGPIQDGIWLVHSFSVFISDDIR